MQVLEAQGVLGRFQNLLVTVKETQPTYHERLSSWVL